MSESTPPPLRYVAYPRGSGPETYGTVERLEALGDGYFGLSRAFALSMVISIFVFILIANLGHIVGENRMIGIAIFLAYSVLAGFLILPSNRRICYGRNWPAGYAVAGSILSGLTSFLCFGMLGILVMQQLALSEIRRYGLKPGFRFNSKRFKTFVEQRQALEKSSLDEPMPWPHSSELT